METEEHTPIKFVLRKNTFQASKSEPSPGVLRPPKYTIDLSLPPEERYVHIVPDFTEQIKPLPLIFDELLTAVPWIPGGVLKFLAKPLFRRVYDDEEQREIVGLVKATGIDLYLLVALNTFLDLFMGCTSGGVRVRNERNTRDTRMLHMRTLDWGMDPLRKLVLELDFIDGNGELQYTSITYLGYVGVLTGLKKGLSLSLNFRAEHDKSTLRKRIAFRWHQAMVLLGKRRSIASELRQVMIQETRSPMEIATSLQGRSSTAAYINLCDGETTVILDNDNRSGVIRQDSNFILAVNHDIVNGHPSAQVLGEKIPVTHMDFLILGSTERQECVEALWMEERRIRRDGISTITQKQLIKWMETCDELSNDETHYGVIMDPMQGKIIWLQRYLEPLEWYKTIQTREPFSIEDDSDDEPSSDLQPDSHQTAVRRRRG